MSQYIVLSQIKVQNANCIAGFTWGFPAITHFLGFTHALHRKLSEEYNIVLGGCAVISHDYQVHVYKPNPKANYEFIQSKNPPVLAKHKKASPPIIEEGKMNLTTSIIIEVTKELVTTSEKIKLFKQFVLQHCLKSRLAGGTILSVGRVDLVSASTDEQLKTLTKKIKRVTMPGFALQDRSDYLKTHFNLLKEDNSNAQLVDAWLDFSAIKYQAHPELKDKGFTPSLDTKVKWKALPRPHPKGWLIPIMTGYKAISECYTAAKVADTRDENTPTCFVEAVHSIGEWRSIHRITDINGIIWRYQHEGDWYLCTQNKTEEQTQKNVIVESEKISVEAALANF